MNDAAMKLVALQKQEITVPKYRPGDSEARQQFTDAKQSFEAYVDNGERGLLTEAVRDLITSDRSARRDRQAASERNHVPNETAATETTEAATDADGRRDDSSASSEHFESELLAGIVEQVGTGVAAYDSSGRIRYVNDHYAEMLATTREELLGRQITFVNPEFEADRFQRYWDSFAPSETRETETRHRKFDGSGDFPVRVVTTHTRIDGTAYHVGTVTDISERKASEHKRELFEEAVSQAGHSVLITDREGVIEYVNPSFEAVTGYDYEDAVGQTPRILKSDRQDDAFYETLWETILSGEVWEAELINKRKSGELYYAEHTIAPMTDEHGNITNFVAVQYDITDRKLREKRLSELNRILRHNLRNTLTALKGHGELLKEKVNPEHQSRLSRMLRQVEDLTSTSEKISDIRSYLNRSHNVEKICNLQSVVNTIMPELRAKYSEAEFSFVTEPAMVSVDGPTCRTLLTELVDNAVVHNDQDTPEVTVAVEVPDDADHAKLHVSDNGPGIPTVEQTAVEIDTEDPLLHGSGIGLSHIHWAITAFGGEVTISERKPRGTVVTLSIPRGDNS